ncbi:MAG: hypothetical protein IPK63_06000 [Candidatus Competibacteraceae bacterium]|nr:hypothetical protein [Candidatus Competibacteraceae bacterium]
MIEMDHDPFRGLAKPLQNGFCLLPQGVAAAEFVGQHHAAVIEARTA